MKQRNWPPRLYLAVDCGGTKAAAAICDEHGEVVGKGRGGPSNFTDEGLHSFLSSVEDAITDALESVKRHLSQADSGIAWLCDESQGRTADSHASASAPKVNGESSEALNKSRANIASALQAIRPHNLDDLQAPSATIQAAWFGIAGVDSPADVTTLSPHLAKMLDLPFPSARLIVANDTSLLASPITDSSRPGIQSGVVAISGTGSIVMSFKRSRSGMLKVLGRVGGFGWVLGDEGSGYSVGRDAVRKVLDLADRERLARERDDAESDSEESGDEGANPGSPQSNGVDQDIDLRVNMSGSTLTDDTMETLSTQTSSSPIKANGEDKTSSAQSAECVAKESRYGQKLRDRILQDWGLLSTDELLRAVYFDDAPSSSRATANFSGVPTIIRSGALSTTLKPLTDASMQSEGDGSLLPLTQAEPSLNLLPPSGTKIDLCARSRRYSPIPSLSSSPSDSSSTAIYAASPRHATRSHRSDSAANTEDSSLASSLYTSDPYSPSSTSERKHRLASLAPLVFHLAFTHADQLCLEILRSQAYLIALQIRDILQPPIRAKAHLSSRNSVLCLGGGLVGQHRYRTLLLDELQKMDIVFSAVEYVADPATRGAMALSTVQEQRADRA